eukprot:Pgem_evm1s2101
MDSNANNEDVTIGFLPSIILEQLNQYGKIPYTERAELYKTVYSVFLNSVERFVINVN